uniref:response regulator n=1 Tax=Pararhizobium sp. IMCC3301 TaxID=3067904 RepID=UPI00274182F7|nr:response regulator [Pararhizobium sp. IMCC3301]
MSAVLKDIMLVEDDSSIAEIATLTLEDLGGFSVVHCASGFEALTVLQKHRPQLILMDVMMPQMDGRETLRQIREEMKILDLPIIFMSARTQTHERAEYVSLGAAGMIAKPFDPMKLSDTVRQMWHKAVSAGEPSADGITTS